MDLKTYVDITNTICLFQKTFLFFEENWNLNVKAVEKPITNRL